MMGTFDDAVRALGQAVGGIAASFTSGASSIPQAKVEERIFALMVEFPSFSDDDVATLARDEIINTVGDDRNLLRWATIDTVARIRRTIVLAYVRLQAAHAAERERLLATGHLPCRSCGLSFDPIR